MKWSYRASGSIWTRLLSLPFGPKFSGHSTTRMLRSGNAAFSRSIAATAGSSRLETPNRISYSPAYSCRQWLANASSIPGSSPFTGFKIVTGGQKSPRAGASGFRNDRAAHSANSE